MRAISVKFDGYGAQYTYLTKDNSIKVGDEVVVVTPTGTKVVGVWQVDCDKSKATEPIVCKVDKEAYQREIDAMAKSAEIDRQIQERVDFLTKSVHIETLAKSDARLAVLLARQKDLNNGC